MGFLENTFHPDRKRQQNWRQFSSEVGGILISEGASGGDEIHIPFMDHRITVSTNTEGRAKRTVLTARHSSEDSQFKIFGWGGRKVPEVDRDPYGWGGRKVPEVDRDPYLNSEFPELAPRAKVEFDNVKKLTNLLSSADLRHFILEVPVSFTLESKPGLLSLDNRSYDSTDNGIITDVDHLHAALNVMKSALREMERIGPAATKKVLIAA